jgi:hypothetical protein
VKESKDLHVFSDRKQARNVENLKTIKFPFYSNPHLKQNGQRKDRRPNDRMLSRLQRDLIDIEEGAVVVDIPFIVVKDVVFHFEKLRLNQLKRMFTG